MILEKQGVIYILTNPSFLQYVKISDVILTNIFGTDIIVTKDII